jgi:hypothetical protein
MQQGKRGVVYAVHAEELKKSDLGQPVQLIVGKSFSQEAVNIELEYIKLKNLHC